MSWRTLFRPAERRAGLAIVLLLLRVGQVAGAPPGAADEPTADARARALSDAATADYAAARFAEAIPLFRQAYELTSNPALLFNLAQSYRRAGDCPHAVESYSSYLASPGNLELRRKAEVLLARLAPACPPPPGAPTAETALPLRSHPAPPPAPLALAASERRTLSPETGPRRPLGGRLALVSGTLALVAGLGAGSILLVNARRHDSWQQEDRVLAGSDPALSLEDRVRRQEANDDALREMRRWDRVATGLAATAVVAALATAVLWLERGPDSRLALSSVGGPGAGLSW